MDKQSKPSQAEVLAMVAETLPDISPHMELDRLWVWYCGHSLRGEEHKTTRDAMSAIGFRFAPKGHACPSGKVGSWAHHCTKPIPRRKGGGRATADKEASSDALTDAQLKEALGL